jgi:predicted nucleic acid-binding protein
VILVDTSVWIDHFRRTRVALQALLEEGEVCTHPMVIGELACGRIPGRREVLQLLTLLPPAVVAGRDETLHLIAERDLAGRGLGYVDVHLLAAALLGEGTRVWTLDTRLAAMAARMLVNYEPAR